MNFSKDEPTDYNFLDYLLDNEFLAPTYTWANAYEVPPSAIQVSTTVHYKNYKKYCKANGYSVEIIF